MKPHPRTSSHSHPHPHLRRRATRALFVLTVGVAALSSAGPANAHPLGNFTTNTFTQLTIGRQFVETRYVVDFAEIPTLKIRQDLGFVEAAVPVEASQRWGTEQCNTLLGQLEITRDSNDLDMTPRSATVSFVAGQAGLSTLRLECVGRADVDQTAGTHTFAISDRNYANRIGWREITAVGDTMRIIGSIASESPSAALTKYPADADAPTLREVSASFRAVPASTVTGSAISQSTDRSPAGVDRGNGGLTDRFQSLIAERDVTPGFAIGAVMLALLLGAMHALAPGHGKTIMAAYAVSRQGSRRDMAAIGATVALTHTVGIVGLGSLVSATSVVSPDGVLRWASLLSGALVVIVGLNLLRSRWRARAAHQHGHHDHHHHDHHDHHDHHEHDHHEHDHHEHGRDRFVVTTHRHGGWSHEHILPAPGTKVRRSELVTMGLAGGLAPSPSALVVLLAAIALRQIPLGLALVVAYGIGLAATLVGVGLLLVRCEGRVRKWTSNRATVSGARIAAVLEVMPLVSGMAIVAAGCLLVLRSL